MVSGVLQVSGINSALAELRCATGGLQTVLLALAWQKPLYLQRLAGLTNEICRRFCLLRDAHGVCEGVGSDGKISLIRLADSVRFSALLACARGFERQDRHRGGREEVKR